MAKLYLVGTPIGNLGDVSFRAIETLKEASAIACEDTRHSLGLLNYYGIKKPLFSCHQHNERESTEKIASMLDQGQSVALITDAGMPCISDPGAIVVEELTRRGYEIEVVPGPTAVASAMALSGITKPIWTFVGFLPSKDKDKKTLLAKLAGYDSALAFYSSPYDLNKDLDAMYKAFGDRRVHVIKELTKIHESHIIGVLGEVQIDNPKGEFVLIVEHPNEVEEQPTLSIEEQLQGKLSQGIDKKEAIKQVAKQNKLTKDQVYKVAMGLLQE
ncbi:MAG: 16S rRNA (cytidine(1402)-2'-O)-methyltransferase [Christensenellales bacterium]